MGDVDLFDVSIFLKSEKKTDGGKAVNDHRTTAILHSCKKKISQAACLCKDKFSCGGASCCKKHHINIKHLKKKKKEEAW